MLSSNDFHSSKAQENARYAIQEDCNPIFQLVNRAYEIANGSTGVAFLKEGVARYTTKTEVLDHIETGTYLVLEVGEIIVAVLYYTQEPSGLYFGPFAVDVGMQGNGYGRKMLEFLEEKARELGLTYLLLDVPSPREDSLKWYLSMDFEETHRGPWIEKRGSVLTRPVETIYLSKEIKKN